MFLPLFRRWPNQNTKPNRFLARVQPRGTCRPELEVLECRLVPATVPLPSQPALDPVLPQQTAATINPTGLQVLPDGNVSFRYTVAGAALAQATTVGIFWSRNGTLAGGIGAPIETVNIAAGTAPGTYGPFVIAANSLGPIPLAANRLLVATDPNNLLGNFAAATSVQTLPAGLATLGATVVNTLPRVPATAPATGLPALPGNLGSASPSNRAFTAGVAGATVAALPDFSAISGRGMGQRLNDLIAQILGERVKQGDYFAHALAPIAGSLGPFITTAIEEGKPLDQIVTEIGKAYSGLEEGPLRDLMREITQRVAPTSPASSRTSRPSESSPPRDLLEPVLEEIDWSFITGDWQDEALWMDGSTPDLASPGVPSAEDGSASGAREEVPSSQPEN